MHMPYWWFMTTTNHVLQPVELSRFLLGVT